MSMRDDIKTALKKFDDEMTLYNVALSEYNDFYKKYIKNNFRDAKLAKEYMANILNSTVFVSDLDKDDDDE